MSTALKSIAAVLAALLMLGGLAACSDDDGESEDDAAPAAGEPDLRGIPDVVATVNEEEISKDEFVTAYTAQFQQTQLQAQQGGEPVDQDALKEQTAEGLVSNELLLQEADRREFTSNDEEVDELLTEFAEQSGAETPDAYLETLAEQGLDEEEVRSQLADQGQLEQLFADEGADEEPSDEELRELYDTAVEQQEAAPQAEGQPEQEIPSFEDSREQLVEQARTQQQNEVAEALLGDLREDADVEIAL
ncbi:SurA N-terminal domain-containing protein [Aeromicrobium sp. CF4.19]|uniref:SurA N-terminal domain-containing protein n=1 Tax=Aeromicrobium sp. CF4.19 TaxID=3373082 RepID=UPI003EE7339F